jgi:hypothetical protein
MANWVSVPRMIPVTIKRTISRTARRHLVKSVAGRRVTVLESDVYITSYPKSGNTWVRFLIANMLHQDGSTDFYNINHRVPDIYTLTDHNLAEIPSPRYLKSHEYFDPRYPKVVYVVRDVRSVVVSLYYHLLLLGKIENGEMNAFVSVFLDGKVNRYGSWRENVLSWTSVRKKNPNKFMLVRYEDLKANCVGELGRVSDFLSLKKSADDLHSIVELSSFTRMKALEKQGIDKMMLGKKHRGIDSGFVRSGAVSEWNEALSEEALDMIYKDCGELLVELGYPVR